MSQLDLPNFDALGVESALPPQSTAVDLAVRAEAYVDECLSSPEALQRLVRDLDREESLAVFQALVEVLQRSGVNNRPALRLFAAVERAARDRSQWIQGAQS